MKKLLPISVIAIFAITPTFADNEPTVIPTPASCNEAVLNTTEGSADLEAIYTANTINTTWYSGYGNNASVSNATQCSYDGTINLPQTNPSRAGYAFNGWRLKRCEIPSSLASTNGSSYGYQNDRTGADGADSGNTSDYGLTEDNTWGVTWSSGDKVVGEAICSQTRGTWATAGTPDTTGAGTTEYCWCRATGYIASGESQCDLSSPSWVVIANWSVSDCAHDCAKRCAEYVRINSGFRAAVFTGLVAE